MTAWAAAASVEGAEAAEESLAGYRAALVAGLSVPALPALGLGCGRDRVFEFVGSVHRDAPVKHRRRVQRPGGGLAKGPEVAAVYARCYTDGGVYVGRTRHLARRHNEHRWGKMESTAPAELTAQRAGIETRYAVLWSTDWAELSRWSALHRRRPERVVSVRESWWIRRLADVCGGEFRLLNRAGAATSDERAAAAELRRLRRLESPPCHPTCMEAVGPSCECPCGGEYHGLRAP